MRIRCKMDKDGHTLRMGVEKKDPKACEYTVLDGTCSKVTSGNLVEVADSLGLIYEGEEVLL